MKNIIITTLSIIITIPYALYCLARLIVDLCALYDKYMQRTMMGIHFQIRTLQVLNDVLGRMEEEEIE